MNNNAFKLITFMAVCFFISGCSLLSSEKQDGMPRSPKDVSYVKDAVPKNEPKSRYGNPKTYHVFGKQYHVLDSNQGYKTRGIASWYGTKFHGRRTSSGEPYDMYAMTAAHKSLPLPTYARVTNLDNGNSVIVKINDRGPFHDHRIIDLSYAAAYKLGILAKGTGHVEVTALTPYDKNKSKHEDKLILAEENASTSKVKSTDGVYLQVGAFSNEQSAALLANKLKRSGHLVSIKTSPTTTLPVYKVQVAVADNTRIAELSNELSEITAADPIVVLQ